MRSVTSLQPGDIVRHVGAPGHGQFASIFTGKPDYGTVLEVNHNSRPPVINVDGTWVLRCSVAPSSLEEKAQVESWREQWRQDQIRMHRQALRALGEDY